MPEISIITAIWKPEQEFLLEGYRDIARQQVDWEWILHWDGPRETLPEEIEANERVRVFDGQQRWGIAITRNRALLESSSDLIYSHDYDDRIKPDALRKSVDAFQSNLEIAYTCGYWNDLVFQDGQWTEVPYPDHQIEPGLLEPGWQSRQENGRAITPAPSSYVFRRVFLEAYGGWGALSSGEDSFLIETIRQRHKGIYLPGTLGSYRKHPANTSLGSEAISRNKKHKKFTEQRVRALRKIEEEF